MRSALEKVFPPAVTVAKRERVIPAFKPSLPEKVVGGEVLWKPINKQAAMLLAKPPWWAYLNYEKFNYESGSGTVARQSHESNDTKRKKVRSHHANGEKQKSRHSPPPPPNRQEIHQETASLPTLSEGMEKLIKGEMSAEEMMILQQLWSLPQ